MTQAMTKPDTLQSALAQSRESIASLLPKHLNADRIIRLVLASVARDEKLRTASPRSIVLAVVQAAELGLEIGGSLGQAYIVPFKKSYKDSSGRWQSSYEAQCVPGFRGLVQLARQSGEIKSIRARVVYEKDHFKPVYGTTESLEHAPTMTGERGEPVAFYAVAEFKDGLPQFEIMTVGDIEKLRARNRKGTHGEERGPWATDYEEMAKKTVIRRLCKMLPQSTQLARALELQAFAEAGTLAPDDDHEEAPPITIDALSPPPAEEEEDNIPREDVYAALDGAIVQMTLATASDVATRARASLGLEEITRQQYAALSAGFQARKKHLLKVAESERIAALSWPACATGFEAQIRDATFDMGELERIRDTVQAVPIDESVAEHVDLRSRLLGVIDGKWRRLRAS